MSDDAVLLYVTTPNEEAAAEIAAALVEARLAACANILPGMRSIYRWDGRIENAEETVLIVKTTNTRAAAARARICALHAYDTPCVLALPIDARLSAPAFLRWIAQETDAP